MTAELTVLLSGRGSNMQAIHAACSQGIVDANLTHVISNVSNAPALDYAKQHGIETTVVKHGDYAQRSLFDQALLEAIDNHGNPSLILLAGFMRRLTGEFTQHHKGRLINIHPSLLPRHPGLNTHAKALAANDKWHGCSVHFVNEALDGGPVIARAVVPVLAGDEEDTLAARVLTAEHRLYPRIVQLCLNSGAEYLDSHVKINQTSLNHPLLYYYQ